MSADRVRRLVVTAGLLCVVVGVFLAVRAVQAATTAGSPGTGTWLFATALVALAVPLARPRLERLADRLAYGRGGDPYAVMSGFVRQIADALAIDDVLPHLARTAAGAVNGESGEVRLWLADGSERRQTWPANRAAVRQDVELALQHAGRAVGRLGVEVAPQDQSPGDREALGQLAGPAGVALANVRLTYELRRRLAQETELSEQVRASRERLLATAQVQRHRFATAVEQQVQRPLVVAEQTLRTGSLAQARAAVQEALDALRDLAAGVFPPALTERGLGDAIELHLQRSRSRATLDVSRLPQRRLALPVETVGYFCAVALVDDGPAGEVGVTLAADDDALHVTVARAQAPAEETLLSVRDRAEAAGGSVRVEPLPSGQLVAVDVPVEGRTE